MPQICAVTFLTPTLAATRGMPAGSRCGQEHFLGSKTISVVPLFLTLFSTIYSGYTLVGVVGMAAGPAAFISTMWLTRSAPVVARWWPSA